MRTYRNRPPRLDVDRALHQVARGRIPLCPRCDHAVQAHTFDDEGQRVCTRGQGLVSCRDCARVQAGMSDSTQAMFNLAETFRLPPRPESWLPLVLR